MKHEYTFDELAELKKIYDESGEAGLSITEMRALRKAGLLTQGLPEKPSKRDLILAHCKTRIDQGQTFDGKETAETLGVSPKTAGNIISQLQQGRGEMRLKFNSESGVFTIEPESPAETIKLRTSALDIANLLVNYFDADIINKPSNQQGA